MVHPGPTGRYLEAAFSPNGRLLTTFSCKDSNVWVWDLVTRKCITMLAVRFGERGEGGLEGGVGCVGWFGCKTRLHVTAVRYGDKSCRRDSLNRAGFGWGVGGEPSWLCVCAFPNTSAPCCHWPATAWAACCTAPIPRSLCPQRG